jgi:hypothetical protein
MLNTMIDAHVQCLQNLKTIAGFENGGRYAVAVPA